MAVSALMGHLTTQKLSLILEGQPEGTHHRYFWECTAAIMVEGANGNMK
jgi:hypothetical protein